jgi:hypothetical protein
MALDRVRDFLQRSTSPAEVIYALEALVAAGKKGKLPLLRRLFREHACDEQKVELLSRWAFSDPYRKGAGPSLPILRHVMYMACAQDQVWLRESEWESAYPWYCSTDPIVPCGCVRWLRENPAATDEALDTLVGHLYDMRSALVRNAWRAEMVAKWSPDADWWGYYHSTVLDCYPCDRRDPDIVRSYEAGISLERRRLRSASRRTTGLDTRRSREREQSPDWPAVHLNRVPHGRPTQAFYGVCNAPKLAIAAYTPGELRAIQPCRGTLRYDLEILQLPPARRFKSGCRLHILRHARAAGRMPTPRRPSSSITKS